MQKFLQKYYSFLVPVTCYLYILLFVYAAISKLLDFEDFRVQLAQSPLLGAYAGLTAPAVISLELLIVLLLSFKTSRLTGLYASFFLMVAFTVYIYLILNYSEFVPCSCGGIIEKLGWTEHLIFNTAFASLAMLAIVILEKGKGTGTSKMVIKSILPSLATVSVVTGLFLSSEHIIKKGNNFIRKFGQHQIRDEKAFDLGVNSYYFAGMADGRIYLGNVTAPLVLTSIDTALTAKKAVKIKLDDATHPFRFIQLQVNPPHFYLYDGTVPVIYRGLLGDLFAHTISLEDCYFSQLQVIDSVSFAFRAQNSQTKSWVLGTLEIKRDPKVKLYHHLLEKQVDGIFDTDGQLMRDGGNGELIYIYTYRNQFLVMSRDLALLRELHTIDTTTTAQVKVRLLPDGQHKMDAPPLLVNKTSALHGQVLFNASMLMGKFESREQWRQSVVVDMYQTGMQEYLGSFYIYHRGKNKMARMFATDRHLFVLSGSELVRYRFAQSVTIHFQTGEAENLEQSRH
ncbi:MAG: hypothetical protein K0M50_06060 [Prolixibacteraceae bacterium]|nr:hypothetical protein [Prolixibacteraceae bacterium]